MLLNEYVIDGITDVHKTKLWVHRFYLDDVVKEKVLLCGRNDDRGRE